MILEPFHYPLHVNMLFHLLGSQADEALGPLVLLECETQVAAGNLELGMAREVTTAGNPHIFTGSEEGGELPLGGHKIEDDSSDAECRVEVKEAVDERCDAVGNSLGTDEEDDGDIKELGDFGSTAAWTVGTVKKAHCSLYDAGICTVTIMMEEVLNVGVRRHDGVQIHRFLARGEVVEEGVDIVRAALEGLDVEAAISQGTQEAHRKGGFAAAGGGCTNEEAVIHF